MQRQGWKVEQVSFIAGARSLNEEEIKKNLAYFEVPSASVEPIRVKLVMTIFRTESSTTGTLQPGQMGGPHLLLSTLSRSDSLTKLGNTRKGRKRERNN